MDEFLLAVVKKNQCHKAIHVEEKRKNIKNTHCSLSAYIISKVQLTYTSKRSCIIKL